MTLLTASMNFCRATSRWQQRVMQRRLIRVLPYGLSFDDVDGRGFRLTNDVRVFTAQPAIDNTCD